MYSIDLSEEATQFFEAASAKLQKRLDQAFEQIKSNPRCHPNIKPLKGNYAGYYRYRVGNYLIIYSIDDATIRVPNCNFDLYISTIREEDQGGLSLPPKLVAAAASSELSIQISILVMLDDYSEPEQESSLSDTVVIDT